MRHRLPINQPHPLLPIIIFILLHTHLLDPTRIKLKMVFLQQVFLHVLLRLSDNFCALAGVAVRVELSLGAGEVVAEVGAYEGVFGVGFVMV